VVGTGFAFAIFYTLIGRVGPARSFIVAYLAPGFAVAYGAVLLGERITVATVAGLALILAGSWLAVEGSIPWRRGEGAARPDSARRPAPSAARPGP
jgi:drug/metabolite transporter (DMT)-like permease